MLNTLIAARRACAWTAIVFLVLAVVAATPARADLITNGDFETPVVGSGNTQQFFRGSTSITGWTVVGNSAGSNVSIVDKNFTFMGGTANAESGNQSVDLSGTSDAGGEGLSQSVTTTIGTQYLVSFWLGRASYPEAGTGATDLYINGSFVSTYTNPNTNPTTINWAQFTYQFAATMATTSVEFLNRTGGSNEETGLDNVSLTTAVGVPEPASNVLFVVGLTAIGLHRFACRRRSK
jgi:hypothetical protein